MLAHLAAGEAHVGRRDPRLRRQSPNQLGDQAEQAAGLGGQVVEGAAQNLVGQAVDQGHVVEGGLHVGDGAPGVVDAAPGALVLVQQGDGADEGEVLAVVPAGPGAPVGEAQPGRLAAIGELSEDRASLLNVVDALITKSRLEALAAGP